MHTSPGLFPHPLLDSLRAAPDSPAFEHGDRTVTRSELLELIRGLAGALRDAGLGPGRALAVRTALTPEAFAAHMAAHALGCRVVGIRPGYPPGQLAHVLAMDVDALLVDPRPPPPACWRPPGHTSARCCPWAATRARTTCRPTRGTAGRSP